MRITRWFSGTVHGFFERIDKGLYLHRFVQVAPLYGLPQLVNWTGNERTEPNERAIYALYHGGEEVLIMTGENGFARVRCSNCRNVARILVHVASSHLEHLHILTFRKFCQQLTRIGRTGPRWIDVHHK